MKNNPRPDTPRPVALDSELVKESDSRFQIANDEFINAFEIRLSIHSQFAMCHPESIASHPLRKSTPGVNTVRERWLPRRPESRLITGRFTIRNGLLCGQGLSTSRPCRFSRCYRIRIFQ